MRYRILGAGWDWSERYRIEDEAGEVVFRVRGPLIRVLRNFTFVDAGGQELLTLSSWGLTDTLKRRGQPTVRVRRKILPLTRPRFELTGAGLEGVEVQGNLWRTEYDLRRGGVSFGRLRREALRVHHRSILELSPEAGEDPLLWIAVAIAVEGDRRDEGD